MEIASHWPVFVDALEAEALANGATKNIDVSCQQIKTELLDFEGIVLFGGGPSGAATDVVMSILVGLDGTNFESLTEATMTRNILGVAATTNRKVFQVYDYPHVRLSIKNNSGQSITVSARYAYKKVGKPDFI